MHLLIDPTPISDEQERTSRFLLTGAEVADRLLDDLRTTVHKEPVTLDSGVLIHLLDNAILAFAGVTYSCQICGKEWGH